MIQEETKKKRKVVYKNGKRTRINSHLKPEKNTNILKEYMFKSGAREWNNHLDSNMFKIKLASNKYYITNNADVVKLTSVNRNLFETILMDKRPSRFVLDIDAKNIGDVKFSYNDLIVYINDIKNYMVDTYDIPNINIAANIHISHPLKIDNNLHDKVFNSSHIIFNFVIEQMNIYAPELLNAFYDYYYNINGVNHPFKEYTDYKIYKSVGWFRCINQTKASNINLKLKKVIKCPLTNKVVETNNIDKSDFIQVDIDMNNIIKINASKENIKSNKYNDKKASIIDYTYDIVLEMPNNLDVIRNKIKKSKYDIYGTSKWHMLVKNLIYCLYTNEIKNINEILNHPLTELLLKASRVDKYDTDECYKENISIIKRYVANFKIDPAYLYDGVVMIPSNELVLWLEHIIGKKISIIRLVNIKSFNYFIIDNEYCYNINFKELMYKYYKEYNVSGDIKIKEYNGLSYNEIIEDLLKSKRSVSAKIKCEAGYNYNIKLINKVNTDNIIFKKKKIKNLIENNNIEEISKSINYKKHNYVWASVGTGKSKNILETYIKSFLNDDVTENKRMLIIADTISITHKQKQDILNILKDLNISKNVLHYYKEKAKKADDYNFNNKLIFITTYDSYERYIDYNFTHAVLDEIKNINKRLITIQNGNKTHQQKIELLYNFINMMRSVSSSIILDADLDMELYDFLNNIRSDITYYKLTNVVKPHNIMIFNQQETISKILNDIKSKHKIIIATASDTLGRDLESLITKSYKDIKVLYINKNGAFINTIADDFNTKNKIAMNRKELILSNVDAEFVKYDVVFYTPTIQTGLSFNIPDYFYRVYGLLNINTIDTTQTCQFLNRCRNTETNDIFLSMNDYGIHTINYNDFDCFADEYVFNHIKNIANNTQEVIEEEFYDEHQIYKESKDIYNTMLKWNNTKTSIRNRKYLFEACVRLIDWGFNNINISLTSYTLINKTDEKIDFEKKTEEEYNEAVKKTLKYSEYDNYVKSTHLDDDTYISLYSKYKDKTSIDQECQDVIKTTQNQTWGYNADYYNQHKNEIDRRYEENSSTKFEWIKQKKLSYLPLIPSIDLIVNNVDIIKSYDDYKKNTRVEIKEQFGLVVNVYFIDKILRLCGVEFIDLYKLCADCIDVDFYTIIKTKELLDKLYKIIEDKQDIINILLKINRIKISDKANRHQRLSTTIIAIFKYFNVKCKFGKNITNKNKCERDIVVNMPYVRIQVDIDTNKDNAYWNKGLLITNVKDKIKRCMYKRQIRMPLEKEVNFINQISRELNKPNITRLVENKNNDYLRKNNQCLIDFTDF